MWFVVFMLTNAPAGGLDTLSVRHYPTERACLASAATVGSAAARAGLHGRFLCMYHGEPNRLLHTAPKVDF